MRTRLLVMGLLIATVIWWTAACVDTRYVYVKDGPPALPPGAVPARAQDAGFRPVSSMEHLDGGSRADWIYHDGIVYHGGPIMSGGLDVILIWYGTWADSTKAIVEDFVQHIGDSSYFAINHTYYSENDAGAKTFAKPAITLSESIIDDYSLGKQLPNLDTDFPQIIESHIRDGGVPIWSQAAYFILISGDVTSDYACWFYCGWHDHTNRFDTDLKYAMIVNPAACPLQCSADYGSTKPDPVNWTSPNGDLGADGVVNILAHELEEMVTDPDLNAWYDIHGMENADKCAWKFGETYQTPNGSIANMKVGARDYLIQQNWVNADGGYCATSYP